jgi:hypothetical protein
MKQVFFILSSILAYITNLNSQVLIFTETFTNPKVWLCEYTTDLEEIYDDTAFCGIIDNRLVVYAHQGGGCVDAKATFQLIDTLNWQLNNYKLKIFINSIETWAALEDNYFCSTIFGHEVEIALTNFNYNEPFYIEINKLDTTHIYINEIAINEYLDEHEQYPLYQYVISQKPIENYINFTFTTRGCQPDFWHGAKIIIDSIQLYELTTGTIVNELNTIENTFDISKNDQTYNLTFRTENIKDKTLWIYSISGKLIQKIRTKNNIVKIDLSNERSGIYVAKIREGKQLHSIKLIR